MNRFLLFFLLITVSCSKPESPRPVAEKFLNAMNERDFEEAALYSTEETQKLLKQLQRIREIQDTDVFAAPGSFEILSEDIQGDKAVVYFRENNSELEQKISLMKVKNPGDPGKEEWKVSLRKEELRLNPDEKKPS